MRRIVLTGSECTGKSTLVKELAEHYQTRRVAEFARSYVAQVKRRLVYQDVDLIARGQIESEDQALKQHDAVPLFFDTDLLSTIVYSRHYYGKCPQWIEHAFEKDHGDLYLLADIDLPWQADGLFRDREEQRKEIQQLFLDALEKRELPFRLISGQGVARFQNAVRAVDDNFAL